MKNTLTVLIDLEIEGDEFRVVAAVPSLERWVLSAAYDFMHSVDVTVTRLQVAEDSYIPFLEQHFNECRGCDSDGYSLWGAKVVRVPSVDPVPWCGDVATEQHPVRLRSAAKSCTVKLTDHLSADGKPFEPPMLEWVRLSLCKLNWSAVAYVNKDDKIDQAICGLVNHPTLHPECCQCHLPVENLLDAKYTDQGWVCWGCNHPAGPVSVLLD